MTEWIEADEAPFGFSLDQDIELFDRRISALPETSRVAVRRTCRRVLSDLSRAADPKRIRGRQGLRRAYPLLQKIGICGSEIMIRRSAIHSF